MSNPYAPPQSLTKSSEMERQSDGWQRLGQRVCGALLGAIAMLAGAVLGFAAFVCFGSTGWILVGLAFGLIGMTLLVIGAAAVAGWRWPAYAITALAMVWLAVLAVELSFVMQIEEVPRRNAVLAIRAFGASPALMVLTIAAIYFMLDLAVRRRRSLLSREPSAHPSTDREA